MGRRWFLVLVLLGAAIAALLIPGSALASGPVIVLDPGHSGTSLTTIDPETQIRDEEYLNVPETINCFDVALRLKDKLEAAGYTVLMTKQNALDTVTKRERADVANNSGAALAVSIHTSGHSFGTYGEIFVQTLTSYRENIYGQRIYFTDPSVAALSAAYGQIFETERRKIEGPSVLVDVDTKWEARGLAPGNIPIVQLFSKVPWILTEAGVPADAAQRELYATSLFNSIVACVPIDGPPPAAVIPVTRFEQTDERIQETGTWGTFAASRASGGDYGRSSSGDASATVNFVGTRLDVIGTRGTTTGIMDIYLDGKPKATVDLAASVASYQCPLWSTGELPSGPHTVELVRNPRSASSKYLTLDAVDIVGGLVAAPPCITSLTPQTGDVAGGTTEAISGTGFTGVTKVTFGGVPAVITAVDSPHQQISAVVPAGMAGTVQVRVTAAGGKTADTPADDFTYTPSAALTRYEQGDRRIVKTGAWKDFLETKASGGSYGRSPTAGAAATLYFHGTGLDWVAMKGTTTGIADVYLDGVEAATVNLAASPVYDVVAWSSGTLPEGDHCGRIVRASASPAGSFLTVDAFDISGTLSDPPTRYEQTDGRISKVGSWSTFSASAASGGSYARSSTSGPPFPASATVFFTGTRLDWVAMRGATAGIADVYLDGVKVATVDLCAANAAHNLVVWSSGNLVGGNHTVRIERNSSSPGTAYLVLDAIDVWGTIGTGP